MPVVLDSSGWIEYFTEGTNADQFAEAIENVAELVVPTVIVMEVYKWILRESGENNALTALATMRQFQSVVLDSYLAVNAAENSHKLKLSLADSVIYTTAQENQAELWTQDADMKNLEGVKYIRHPDRN